MKCSPAAGNNEKQLFIGAGSVLSPSHFVLDFRRVLERKLDVLEKRLTDVGRL